MKVFRMRPEDYAELQQKRRDEDVRAFMAYVEAVQAEARTKIVEAYKKATQ